MRCKSAGHEMTRVDTGAFRVAKVVHPAAPLHAHSASVLRIITVVIARGIAVSLLNRPLLILHTPAYVNTYLCGYVFCVYAHNNNNNNNNKKQPPILTYPYLPTSFVYNIVL